MTAAISICRSPISTAISVAIIAMAMAGCGMPDAPNSDLASAIRTAADRLGIDPVDLGTAISYETGGRMSSGIWGGSGGKYLGLIQFSPENQKRYGVTPQQAPAEQMGAVENYLRDRGVKPGMQLLDIYSAINAGRPGLYNRSDAHNGGAPGTVADKVATMAPHRVRASLMLDGKLPASLGSSAPTAGPSTVASASGSAPMSLAPSQPADTSGAPDPTVAALQQIAAGAAKQPEAPAQQPQALDLQLLQQHIARAQALARMGMPNNGMPTT